ncbi:hypothetical protein PF005_g7209 [Phytophthora fragariae]|uniref:RxLR effector protein n=1 Tax=Phytophthora fragariae TaxID=53985 RepID=A0A6A3LM49_9STRA|nr:hypothetical protein PF003_g12261 [Phytophthora fragariae]KAE9019265.1 hypothetical protein PF011_g5902 [Phytophthora fragariae]KAE9064743.1 hypothetical protein PF006_g30618 [Phytophthora fragariae]KAE9122849.1 hypothetical protein PF007_g7275 [Phytophthora fragariae]KAE9124410.1 hypothetical protein PF010_g6019 [Phytophthora fragariae]
MYFTLACPVSALACAITVHPPPCPDDPVVTPPQKRMIRAPGVCRSRPWFSSGLLKAFRSVLVSILRTRSPPLGGSYRSPGRNPLGVVPQTWLCGIPWS